MCQWNSQCSDINNQCVSASPVLGCAKRPSECETCALGMLNRIHANTLIKPHLSIYATLGKLRAGKGWEITRPGKGTDLEIGSLVTEINGQRLDGDMKSAKQAIVDLYEYTGEAVTLGLRNARGRVIQREFKRT